MDTPFLDNSCMNTPFTPASLFTPNLDQFQNSPYIQPSTHCDSTTTHLSDPTNDVQVANYLKNDIPWQNPIHVSTIDLFPQVSTDNQFLNSFNGDPNQLLLNTSDNTVASSSEESTDFLFPPLPSDNQQTTITSLNEQQEQEQQNSFNSQEFDINALFGDCFDDVFFGITQQDEQQQQQQQQNKHKTSSSIPNKVIKHTKESFISIKDNTLVIKKKKVDQNERRFKCHICQAMFNRRYNLGTHIKTHDKNRNKEFTCSICQKSFDRKHDMTRHVATVHKGERAFRCKYCTSSFSRKDVLARHCMQKHNDVH
ncbi:uncharacterized protein BX663DRAFT_506677 [Cokeromyces recurvatus]|uniref:uncharacterized protein n=1 Tax=Cokeromyces recurvatus TaxID=90255 RepID=UPI0022203720|nr:uncharacterized protein BX663DRAFT_506677 [Cokeromyces recurvatus]KAI7903499.1 hypothetical protein BX663DRAFT_506677 [Cokeromyces recurvatus]